jgi:putative hemolysin
MPGDPFDILLPEAPLSRAALNVARPLLEKALALNTLRTLYRQTREMTAGSFPARALRALDVAVDADAVDLAHIPAEGPLVVAANHPHGALDGLVLATAVERVRPDVKLVANRSLARIPELRDLCFFVDPFGGTRAADRSRAGLRDALRWLQQGHSLVVFPAGEVAHRPGRHGTRADSTWLDTFARLARAAGAPVVPAFIAGANSGLFYGAGLLHSALRTALLPGELARSRGRLVRIRFAEPIVHTSTSFQAAARLASSTRTAVDRLHAHQAESPADLSSRFTDAELAAEVEALADTALLMESGRFAVFCAPASSIPRVLDEIGRLRELTYRAVGEGSGRRRDLDRFDSWYTHLFVWDRAARRLAGAYRIGDVTSIVRRHGVSGLYTRQLFTFDRRFVGSLAPALELGRSWVRAEYQRHSNALLTLWRGIGRYVVERSDARVLFGPVSISASYSGMSHALLQSFLAQNHHDTARASLVEPIHPPDLHDTRDRVHGGADVLRRPTVCVRGERVVVPRTIDEADALVSRIEADGKGMPVLLRQYLKLNARLIGFIVDPDFGDALDALMMVDLADVDPTVLARYLGPHAARAVCRNHLAA